MLKSSTHSIVLLFALSLFTACATGSSGSRSDIPASPNLVNGQNGEEEHELIIIDPGFSTWFITHGRSVNYYAPQFYETWNQQYVAAWNARVNQQLQARDPNYPFINRIDYDPNENYGVELNHELFWYFRYIQSLYGDRYNFPGFSVRNF